MITSSSVFFIVSAGPRTGYGHLRRCATLAERIVALGGAARIWAVADPGWRVACFTPKPAGVSLEQAESVDGALAAATARAETTGDVDWLVFDSYVVTAEQEALGRSFARRIIVLDDLPTRLHDVDLLLDPTVGRTRSEYAPFLSDEAAGVFGPRWALLRPAFAEAGAQRTGRGKSDRLLVAFGGVDPDDATGRVVRALAKDGHRMDVVLGGAAPHLEALRQWTGSQSDADVKVHVDLDAPELAQLMARAPLVIGAGGGGAWERCASGAPALGFQIADNQRDVLRRLGRVEALIDAGDIERCSDENIRKMVVDLQADATRLDRLAAAGRAVCDGLGAVRTAALIGYALSRSGLPVRLRPATPADCDRVLMWQQAPGARRFARTSAAPTADEHKVWFADRLERPDRPFLIVERGGDPVGFVRLDPPVIDPSADFELSILISFQGASDGVARAALRLAAAVEPSSHLVAEIFPENKASQAAFAAAGFRQKGERLWYLAAREDIVGGALPCDPNETETRK